MKKFIILLVAVMAMGVQTASAQYAKVMLQHNGKATLFETTEVQKAIDASVDGDSIYIGEGPYNSSSLTITKKITIIGQGEKSKLGDIYVSLPGGSEMTSTLLYGISAGSLTIGSSMTKLHIDKCTFSSLTITPSSTTSTKTYVMKDMLIERCKITGNTYIKQGTDGYENGILRNCNLGTFFSESKEISCINCKIASFELSVSTNITIFYGNYMNCIVIYSSIWEYARPAQSVTFTNCQLGFTPSAGTKTDCYHDSNSYTNEELQVKGYLGTDGTIVGPYGGVRPYNLTPAVPSLEDIKLDVNYNTKKLNVTVKVKAN